MVHRGILNFSSDAEDLGSPAPVPSSAEATPRQRGSYENGKKTFLFLLKVKSLAEPHLG